MSVPLLRPHAELGEVARLEVGRAGEVSLRAGGGDGCKDLGEHEGWEGKEPKDYAGGQQLMSKGGDGPSAPLCHDGGTGVGVRWDPSSFCGRSLCVASFSSRERRRRSGGRGPPPSMAMAASASPPTRGE